MEKNIFRNFINKYYLGGLNQSVIFKTENKELKTQFNTGDKSVIGYVNLKHFDYDNSEIGIYETKNLLNLITPLQNEIDIELIKKEDKYTSIKIGDDSIVIDYVLSPLDIIPIVPSIKRIPVWDLEFELDKQLIDNILKSYSAYSKVGKDNSVVFYTDDSGELKITFGYSSQNTNRITINTGIISNNTINHFQFKSHYLQLILINNRDFETIRFKISNEGLTHLSGESDLFKSEYYGVVLKH